MVDSAPAQQNIAAVAIKLPVFWKNDPHMWFAQAEAQFHLAQVTKDETKFWHIIAKIDQSVICHVSDLVSNPPLENKYDAVKDRLIARFALSPQARLEQLLGSCDLGDLRPTHLLAKMQESSTGLNVDDALMKMLFLQRMPQNVRVVLSISDGSLQKLAEMADKMIDSSTVTTAAVQIPAQPTGQNADYTNLKEEIEVLTAEIRRLKTTPVRNRSRSSSNSGPRGEDVYWYHLREQSREPMRTIEEIVILR
ncbi:uncharacterized protein LOC129764267 [Toxorhynchites rutilus septentrionalis]|uniref:uncharacterized protein LOC129764267 n=1 Tax=Toxorhynchites rutilus septentrionalis TaxID=329112 RepID=UPI0024797BAA|nr:uncharacterized protein LOC129764267 [Toxorhynchites rutilus septentrionalis]